MSAIRAVRRGAAWGGAALLFAALPLLASAQQGARSGARGDGRGLATFGDRGLTTFGDRFGEGYGDRPLESFGDVPLESMGGLERSGRKAAGERPDGERRSPAHRRLSRLRPRVCEEPGGRTRRPRSVATLHGVVSASAVDLPRFELPPVERPVVLLDLTAAESELAAALRDEAAAAAARGDASAAAWLSEAAR